MQILYYILITAHTKDIKNAITTYVCLYLLIVMTFIIYINIHTYLISPDLISLQRRISLSSV